MIDAHLVYHQSGCCGGLSACAPVFTKDDQTGAGISSFFNISVNLETNYCAGTSKTLAIRGNF